MGENISTRVAYGRALAEFGADENIYVFDADLKKCTMTLYFSEKYPERFYNIGIAEANMVDVAAGFATCGATALVHTFAIFAAGRVYDQVRNNVCYPGLNVKVVGSHAGLTVGEDGATHQALEDISLMDNFLNHRVRNFYTFMKTRFVFQILYRNAQLYLTALRSIDRQSDKLEAQLENATKNEHLIDMMELEKSIVYLKASLKMNERIVKKLTGNASSLKKYIEDEDLLEDTLVETQQAIEMAGIYENVLNAMAETSASIIGNNQNTIMKTLALMTMALDIPTVIFSAYGMNFKNNSMPLNDLDNAFWVIFFMAVFGSSCVVIYFIRKKWF